MGNNHHGHALPGQFLHNIQHFANHFRVQCGGGFVKKHDLGLHHQRPNNGYTLLLTAGQLDGVSVGAIFQTDPRQQRQRLLGGLLLGHLQHFHRCQNHVLQNGLVGEEVEMLEHHAHLLPVQVDVHLFLLAVLIDKALLGDVDVVENDLAVGRSLHQVQAAQKGGFAGTGRTDDDHYITLLNVDAHIVQGFDCALVIVLFQVLDLNQVSVCHRGSSSFRNMRSAWKWGSTGRSTPPLPPAGAP